jgi:hypothetical protein
MHAELSTPYLVSIVTREISDQHLYYRMVKLLTIVYGMFMTFVSVIFRITRFKYALSMDGKGRGRGGDGIREGTGRK